MRPKYLISPFAQVIFEHAVVHLGEVESIGERASVFVANAGEQPALHRVFMIEGRGVNRPPPHRIQFHVALNKVFSKP